MRPQDLIARVEFVLNAPPRIKVEKAPDSGHAMLIDGVRIDGWGFTQLAIINRLCGYPGARYLEFGVYRGLSLVCAARGNPATLCVGVDSFFRERRPEGFHGWRSLPGQIIPADLERNIAPYPNALVLPCDFRDAAVALEAATIPAGFTVGYIDSDHREDATRDAMLAMRPLLASPAVILADDYHAKFRDGLPAGVSGGVQTALVEYAAVHREWILASPPGGPNRIWIGVVSP